MSETKLVLYQPMKYWWLYFLISLSVLIPGTYSLIRHGLLLGIDFTGGTTMTWEGPSLSNDSIHQATSQNNIDLKDLKHTKDVWTLTTNPLTTAEHQAIVSAINSNGDVQELSFDTLGPALGAELVRKTIYGIVLAASFILLYVAYRFRNLKFGISAILAMLHDLLVVLGVFSLLGFYLKVEVDTLFVTALLTILSFSVHDTIVVYDRIRELKKKHAYLEFNDITNRAVVETMGRSINNSMTIIFMLLAMYLLGGETTKWFIFALLIGTISGTYSSTFTTAPILVIWDKFDQLSKKKKLLKKS